MALQKQSIPINFAKGLDLKTDPKQVAIGNFLVLKNSVFNEANELVKRNGFGSLPTLPADSYTYLTTYQDDLVAIGPELISLSDPTMTWIDKGSFHPTNLSVLSLIRSNLNQSQADSAVTSNGLVCVAWTETVSFAINSYKFAVYDSNTGQNVVLPTTITPSSGSVTGAPRVFALGNYFIVVFTATITAADHLQYIAVNVNSLAVGSAVNITSSYTSASSVAWDGVVANNSLYLAWNGAAASGIKMTFIDSSLVQHATTNPDPSHTASVVGICSDNTGTTPVIWVAYTGSAVGYVFAVNQNLVSVLAPTNFNSANSTNITCSAQNMLCAIFVEEPLYTQIDNTINQSEIKLFKVPQAGTVVTITIASPGVITTAGPHGLSVGDEIFLATTGALPTGLATSTIYYVSVVVSTTKFQVSATSGGSSINTSGTQSGVQSYIAFRFLDFQVGLASKSFIVDGSLYVLSAFQSPNQPSLFLLNESGKVVTKLAYQNGGGYLTTGLPGVSLSGVEATFTYLFKDLVQATNKTTGITNANGVYSQTGVNLAHVSFSSELTTSVEGADTLNISGGFLWGYDGSYVTENNFFLWPELIAGSNGSFNGISTAAVSVTPTGTTTNGSTLITGFSALTNIHIGMKITGTGIPANTIISQFVAGTNGAVISQPATASGSVTLTITGNVNIAQQYNYQFTYEWMDNQGNINRSAPSIPVSQTTTGTTSVNTIKVPMLPLTYKTANPVKLVGYRWSTAQPIYYQFTSIPVPVLNDPTQVYATIYDAFSDATIIGNNILYTTGGVVEDLSPPPFTAVTLFNGRLFGIDSEDDNTLWFSKPIIPTTPIEMSDALTYFCGPLVTAFGAAGKLSCGAQMDDKLILFYPTGARYLTGQGPDLTGNNSDYPLAPTFITSAAGCTNQNSIVFQPNGIMFEFNSEAGNQIWIIRRNLETFYLGSPVEDLTLNDTVLSAIAIPGTNQVRFTMASGNVLMYDWFFNQWGMFDGIPGISSVLYRGLHSFINEYGQVFKETEGAYLDGGSPVLMGFTTSWITPSGLQGYQRAYWAFLLGEYFSPHKLTVGIAYDFNPAVQQQIIITPDNYSAPFGGSSTFGSSTPFGGPSSLEQWQLNFKQQSCEAFRLTVTESFDPSIGAPAGAGLTLSGINLVVGLKKPYPRTLPASRKVG